MKNIFLLLVLIVVGVCGCNGAKDAEQPTQPVDTEAVVLTQNLQFPWELLWGPDDFIWMTERGGKISRVNAANGAVTPVFTITEVVSQGEGGLLGMALHPQFATNPFVYVAYNYINSGYKEKVVRYTYNGTTLTAPLVLIDGIQASSIHNGCRLLIAGDKLFITTGDAADPALAQNTSSPNGKILRLNLNGSVPADNPFAGNPLWSFGHRNAQGLVIVDDKLFSSEHGPDRDDEINIIEKGRNFGWPTVMGYCNESAERSFCNANNVKEPIEAWTPTLAVGGMEYYNSNSISQWKNSLLVATLKNNRLYQLKLNDGKTDIVETREFFTNTYGRLRDVCVAPDGKVYMCTSNGSDDKIIEVRKK